MKTEKRKKLLEKGWEEKEIKKAEDILERAEHHDVFFSKIVFWSALIVIIFGNLLISLILIPFLIVLNQWVLYSIVTISAIMIGFLYNFLITDIGLLEKKHHRMASIIIPLIALANMIVMVMISNQFIISMNFIHNQPHNPITLSLVFGFAFIFPYVIDQIRLKINNNKNQ
ncbi:MAG: hypothetical protein ABH824_00360 [Nanoarchaeota archaeon]